MGAGDAVVAEGTEEARAGASRAGVIGAMRGGVKGPFEKIDFYLFYLFRGDGRICVRIWVLGRAGGGAGAGIGAGGLAGRARAAVRARPVAVQRGHRGQRGAGGGRAGRGALGAGGAVQYQSSAAAYDPRLHDASFLVERLSAGWSRGSAWTLPYPAVRATFGRPARSYRFDGYEVLVWNVNLLTRMGE